MTEVEKKVEEKKPTVSNSSRLMLLVSRLNKMIENLPPAESDFVISTLASLRSVEAQNAYRSRQFSDFHAKLPSTNDCAAVAMEGLK